jgi:hypothetical protein
MRPFRKILEGMIRYEVGSSGSCHQPGIITREQGESDTICHDADNRARDQLGKRAGRYEPVQNPDAADGGDAS